MTEITNFRRDRCPSHPGALLADVIQDAGRTKLEVARLLGISRQHLHDLISERKPVSPHVAARLGKFFGDGAAVWLRMQAGFDAWHAERETDLSGVAVLAEV